MLSAVNPTIKPLILFIYISLSSKLKIDSGRPKIKKPIKKKIKHKI